MSKMKEEFVDNAKKMSEEVKKAGRNAWLVGLGALAVAEEETRGLFDKLRAKGESFEKDERNVVGKAIDEATGQARRFGETVEGGFQDVVGATLNRAGIPSREEIQVLIRRVEQLNEKVDALNKDN